MTIHRKCLNEDERIYYTASRFGEAFPFRIEPFVFNMARNLSKEYTGGLWDMFELSNGGFYMAPISEKTFHVESMNGYQGTLSSDGFGLTVFLYSYSNLSFSEVLADVCGEQFHLVREYLFEHPECKAILSAID